MASLAPRVVIAAPSRLNPYPVLFHRSVRQADPSLPCELWRDGLSWRRLLGRERPDILHLHWLELLYQHYAPPRRRLLMWLNLLGYVSVARLLGIRIIYTVHNVWHHEEVGRRLHRLANGFVLRSAAAVHVHDDVARDHLQRSFRVRAPVVVVPHGNYIGWYANDCTKAAARERLGLPPDSFIYLSLGHVRPYKGMEELLAAFAELPAADTLLLIAGRARPPEQGEWLRSQAEGDARVRLCLDYVPDDEMQLYMNGADAVVLPYRRATTSGAAILAISFGVPVIAPALGPFPALLQDGGGILYDPLQPDGLAAALQAAMHADMAEMKRSAWKAARRLDWEPIGQRLAALYRRVAAT